MTGNKNGAVDRFGNIRSELQKNPVDWPYVATLLGMTDKGQEKKSAVLYATERAMELDQYDAYLKAMSPRIHLETARRLDMISSGELLDFVDGEAVVEEYGWVDMMDISEEEYLFGDQRQIASHEIYRRHGHIRCVLLIYPHSNSDGLR